MVYLNIFKSKHVYFFGFRYLNGKHKAEWYEGFLLEKSDQPKKNHKTSNSICDFWLDSICDFSRQPLWLAV